jgi:hypothetical protein
MTTTPKQRSVGFQLKGWPAVLVFYTPWLIGVGFVIHLLTWWM